MPRSAVLQFRLQQPLHRAAGTGRAGLVAVVIVWGTLWGHQLQQLGLLASLWPGPTSFALLQLPGSELLPGSDIGLDRSLNLKWRVHPFHTDRKPVPRRSDFS